MNNKPLKKVNPKASAQEVIEIDEDCQFMQDLHNKRRHQMALYNLALAKGQLKLFNKGILPTRSFRLKHVKIYFGMTGNKKVMLNKITLLQDVLKGAK
jgi:hypothetical protein